LFFNWLGGSGDLLGVFFLILRGGGLGVVCGVWLFVCFVFFVLFESWIGWGGVGWTELWFFLGGFFDGGLCVLCFDSVV